MDIEQRLRGSLAATEPPPDFEARVMARLVVGPVASSRRRFNWRPLGAIAASTCAVAFALHWHVAQQREAHVRQQLMLALEITSEQLNLVQRRLVHFETIEPASQENGT
ncbi:MAG: hypothetical protein ABW278_05730 [Steroidobacteraceae bacterium]